MRLSPILCALVLVAGQAKPLPAGVRVGFAPRDAAIAAWVDLSQNVPVDEHRWQWYLWNDRHEELPEATAEPDRKKAADASRRSAAVLNMMVNEVLSRNGRIISPEFVADGRLLRYDLRRIAPKREDFLKLWNALQEIGGFESTFHQPADKPQEKWIRVPSAPYRSDVDGQIKDYVWKKVTEHRDREFGLHAGGAGPLRLLSEQCGGSLAPILRASEFLAIAYVSVDIDGIQGRYYELAGIEKKPKQGTAFDAFLKSIGVDPVLAQQNDFAQRAAMISGVTKRWRRVDAFYATKVRPEFGPSLVTVTRDIKNTERGARRNAYLNLLHFEDQAREVIAAKPNGLHLFLLTDGAGAVQDVVPDTVAPWKESPHGGSAQLIPGIACKACHGKVGGYQAIRNEVRNDLRKGFAPVADATSGKSAEEVREEIESFYDGDLDGPIRQATNAYATAVDRSTWGLFGKEAVRDSSAWLMDKWYSPYIADVTPLTALRESGFIAKDEATAAKAIAAMCPPVADEHGLIGHLRGGGAILRQDWNELSYEVQLRMMLYREAMPEFKK